MQAQMVRRVNTEELNELKLKQVRVLGKEGQVTTKDH